MSAEITGSVLETTELSQTGAKCGLGGRIPRMENQESPSTSCFFHREEGTVKYGTSAEELGVPALTNERLFREKKSELTSFSRNQLRQTHWRSAKKKRINPLKRNPAGNERFS
mmetsp:Transcript_24969/g.98651  ORF Transcript_24969/g.98651 Transcript_24969/m.98651 type:complete len:113 (-) Transcript_24969:2105-2443(-)